MHPQESSLLIPPLFAYHIEQLGAKTNSGMKRPSTGQNGPPTWPPRNIEAKQRAKLLAQTIESVKELQDLTMWATMRPFGFDAGCVDFLEAHIKSLNGTTAPELTYNQRKAIYSQERECIVTMRLYLLTAYSLIGEVMSQVQSGISPMQPIMYSYFRRTFSISSLSSILSTYVIMADDEYPEYHLDFLTERQTTFPHIKTALLALEKELVHTLSILPGKFDRLTLRRPDLIYDTPSKPGHAETKEFRASSSMSLDHQWTFMSILMRSMDEAFKKEGIRTDFGDICKMGARIAFTVLDDMINEMPEVRKLYFRTQRRAIDNTIHGGVLQE